MGERKKMCVLTYDILRVLCVRVCEKLPTAQCVIKRRGGTLCENACDSVRDQLEDCGQSVLVFRVSAV